MDIRRSVGTRIGNNRILSLMICETTQGFYDNKNNAYAGIGLKAHSGLDIECGYGTDIEFPLDGFVSNVLDKTHLASDGFWAVYVICMYNGVIGELCVGHCSRIDVKVGDLINKGQVIGAEGNHGLIYYGNTLITLVMQAAGDTRGHHRHWQWRPLIKTKYQDPSKQYITSYAIGAYKDPAGYYYEVENYDNGYHGLSPDIASILNDYGVWKHGVQNTSGIPIQVTPEQKSALKRALDLLTDVLSQLFSKRV